MPKYVIQANWQAGKLFNQGYLNINSLTLFADKKWATLLDSKALANGWILKAQIQYPTFRFSLIET